MDRLKCVLRFAVTALVLTLLASQSLGCGNQATYPSKAIELVVPWAAGGGTDVIARVAAKHLSKELGVPVNVSNKTGGNGIPGVLAVLEAPADGYTMLFDAQGSSSIQAATLKDLPYKIEDRTFGPSLVSGPNTLAVNGKSPWNSLKDVAEAAKKNPESFTWVLGGGGVAIMDFTIMQFLQASGADISKTKSVEFSGMGPGLTAVAGGHVMLGGSSPGAVLPLSQSGDLKVLAVTGDKRVAVLPNVPSASEAGFPNIDLTTRFSISGPKDLPKEILDKWDAAAKKITQDAAFKEEMEKTGSYPLYASPKDTRDFFLGEVENFKKLAASLNVS